MISKKEKNTELFYKELNSETCNIELVYNLSLDGIFLYDPLFNYEKIKYHEYAISISYKYQQFCKIFNDEQYNKFSELFKKDKNYWIDLLIPNKYLINRFVNDNFLSRYTSYDISIYYLSKYNYISFNLFNFFKLNNINYETIIYIYIINKFYLNEKIDLSKLTKYIDKHKYLINLLDTFGKDINILHYIIDDICSKYKYDCESIVRIGPWYPLKLLKELSPKLFNPNKLYFKHKDKYLEELFNNIFSDESLKFYSTNKPIRSGYISKEYFEIYNIPENIKDYEILNIKKYGYERIYVKRHNKNDFWFGNKDLFNIEYELKKNYYEDNINNRTMDLYSFSFDEIIEFCEYFKENYLNGTEFLNILKDPEYIIYKFENDKEIKKIYLNWMLVKSCVIGSFIYNNKSKYIIKTLTDLLNLEFPVSYNYQTNEITFETMTFAYLNSFWNDTDYNTIVYNTLTSTTDDKFNKIFNLNDDVFALLY